MVKFLLRNQTVSVWICYCDHVFEVFLVQLESQLSGFSSKALYCNKPCFFIVEQRKNILQIILGIVFYQSTGIKMKELVESDVTRALTVNIANELIDSLISDLGALVGDDVLNFYIKKDVLLTLMVPVLWVSNISKLSLIEIIYSSVKPGRIKGFTSNLAFEGDLFIKICSILKYLGIIFFIYFL